MCSLICIAVLAVVDFIRSIMLCLLSSDITDCDVLNQSQYNNYRVRLNFFQGFTVINDVRHTCANVSFFA